MTLAERQARIDAHLREAQDFARAVRSQCSVCGSPTVLHSRTFGRFLCSGCLTTAILVTLRLQDDNTVMPKGLAK